MEQGREASSSDNINFMVSEKGRKQVLIIRKWIQKGKMEKGETSLLKASPLNFLSRSNTNFCTRSMLTPLEWTYSITNR